MKTIFTRLSVFGLVVFGIAVLAAAQSSTVSDSDFYDVSTKSYKGMGDVAHRITEKTEKFASRGGKLVSTRIELTEFVPPDRNHWKTTIRSITENKTTDTIAIDRKVYRRGDDGKWKLDHPEGGSGNGSGSGDEVGMEPLPSVNTVRKTTLDGQAVDLYERTRTYVRSGSPSDVEYVEKSSYWVRSDGRLAKSLAEGETTSTKSFVRVTTIYEYGDQIKIEEPVVTQAKENK